MPYQRETTGSSYCKMQGSVGAALSQKGFACLMPVHKIAQMCLFCTSKACALCLLANCTDLHIDVLPASLHRWFSRDQVMWVLL